MVQKVNSLQKRKLNKVKKLSIASLITEKNKNKNLLILSDFKIKLKKQKKCIHLSKI